jgi:hypothetical protein
MFHWVAFAVTAVLAVAAFALPFLGFATSGIAAGSCAAILQAGIGNVVAGSGFALLQSLGATGLLVKIGLFLGGVAAFFVSWMV